MTVSFFGHGSIYYSFETEQLLVSQIESLIKKGAVNFLSGGYGNFDCLVAKSLFNLKTKYPFINSTLVIPYLNKAHDLHWYDSTLYPDLETIPKKLAVIYRNRWMIEHSDVVIFYVAHNLGGAYDAMKYARKLNKPIINLFSSF